MKKIVSRPLIVFYILLIYIIIQFCWWGFHIYTLEIALNDIQEKTANGSDLSKKLWMVLGEGTVFLLLLVTGALITRNSFKKEAALSNQQRNFLLSITHELKSPIAAIKLYLETLQKRDLEKEKQKEILAGSLRETERLLSLVENILFSAKIESGNFSLYSQKLNVSELIEEIISLPVSRELTQKNHRFRLNINPGVFLNTDKQALSSIVLNLVENALKYSPSGSEIGLQLQKGSGKVIFSVTDNGAGISDLEKNRIFEKFYRIGNEETRKTKGTGLGLFIVKHLVVELGGTINVRDNSGKGSIFEVTFPISETD